MSKTVKGAPLQYGELKALPDGAEVYVTYREHYDSDFRLNYPMILEKMSDMEGWFLSRGEYIREEFVQDKNHLNDSDQCVDFACGEGVMQLFRVETAINHD